MRKAGYDLARIAAIAAAVLVHTVMLFWDFDPAVPTWAVYNYLSLTGHFCIPLFFMISGALLLGRETLDLKKHLRRTGHFFLLFYAWSLICYGIDARFFHIWTFEKNWISLLPAGYYHEWFLSALVICYCAVPLLHGLLHGNAVNARKGAWLVCALVAGLSTLKVLGNSLPALSVLLRPWQVSDLQYLACFLLGWLLASRRPSRRVLTLLGISALALQLLFSWLNRRYAVSVLGRIRHRHLLRRPAAAGYRDGGLPLLPLPEPGGEARARGGTAQDALLLCLRGLSDAPDFHRGTAQPTPGFPGVQHLLVLPGLLSELCAAAACHHPAAAENPAAEKTGAVTTARPVFTGRALFCNSILHGWPVSALTKIRTGSPLSPVQLISQQGSGFPPGLRQITLRLLSAVTESGRVSSASSSSVFQFSSTGSGS